MWRDIVIVAVLVRVLVPLVLVLASAAQIHARALLAARSSQD